MDGYEDYFDDIKILAERLNDLAKTAVPFYKDFTEDVVSGRKTDINEIELQLDYMVSLCFSDEILLLYKTVLRKLYDKYPDIVKSHIDLYFEMYGDCGDSDYD